MNVAVAQAELTPSASKRISAAKAWEPALDEWRAWHIFIHDPAAMDRFVATALAQTLSNLPAEASGFFIRYWENGPHIRLRLRGLKGEHFESIGEALQLAASELAAQSPPREHGFGEGMQYDSWHPDPANLPWFDSGSVLEIMYEPEWRRYGGRHGMGVHERLFVQSSAQVIPVVAATH
ncbi:MAG: lantibiotic dehydratase C-terminal domain-containing protein, partial [Pseudomonadota bacterium]